MAGYACLAAKLLKGVLHVCFLYGVPLCRKKEVGIFHAILSMMTRAISTQCLKQICAEGNLSRRL
jgi:hypothetical protein